MSEPFNGPEWADWSSLARLLFYFLLFFCLLCGKCKEPTAFSSMTVNKGLTALLLCENLNIVTSLTLPPGGWLQ